MSQERKEIVPNIDTRIQQPSPFAIDSINYINKAGRELSLRREILRKAILRAHIATDNSTINKSEKAIAAGALYASILDTHRKDTQNYTTQQEVADAVDCCAVTVRHVYEDIIDRWGVSISPTNEYIDMITTNDKVQFQKASLLDIS